jgi:hypothetical protein
VYVRRLHRVPTAGVGRDWAAIAITLVALIPQAIIVVGVRPNRLSDRHVPVREQRPGLIVLAPLSIVAGLRILFALHASRELLALLAAMLVGLVVILIVTLFWKVSLHTRTLAGAVSILVLALGPISVVLYTLVILVGWARVKMGDHNFAQIGTGALLGSVVAAAVFSPLRGRGMASDRVSHSTGGGKRMKKRRTTPSMATLVRSSCP